MAAEKFESHDEMDQPAAQDKLGVALIVLTTISLLVAFILIESGMSKHFNQGMFADPKAAPAAK